MVSVIVVIIVVVGGFRLQLTLCMKRWSPMQRRREEGSGKRPRSHTKTPRQIEVLDRHDAFCHLHFLGAIKRLPQCAKGDDGLGTLVALSKEAKAYYCCVVSSRTVYSAQNVVDMKYMLAVLRYAIF